MLNCSFVPYLLEYILFARIQDEKVFLIHHKTSTLKVISWGDTDRQTDEQESK
jgi:hypothetical protein